MFRKLSSVEGLFGFIYIPYFSYDILIGCLFLCSSITLLTYMCSFSLLVIFLYWTGVGKQFPLLDYQF